MESRQKYSKPKVTVYTPSHNYGRFLEDAVESILDQIFTDWELLIILDGSVDESAKIASRYQNLYPDKIRTLSHPKKRGLQFCANLAIKEARGDYIVRLDPDDKFDESALLVMSTYLDKNKDVVLVYPNYFYIDEDGEILDFDIRKKVGQEAKLLDLPAHGACTMIRKRVLKSVGGYNEKFDSQDGYDLWLKVVRRFPVGNTTTPLFYYRQHPESVTKNEERILKTRGKIKRHHSELMNGSVQPSVLAVIGAKTHYKDMPGIALREMAGKALISYTLDPAINSKIFDKIVVSTDDHAVEEYCEQLEDVTVRIRAENLSGEGAPIDAVIFDTVTYLENDVGYFPDIVVFLNSHAPLKGAEHIQKAVDTLILDNTDSVVSVYENFNLHYLHGRDGLIPLAKDRHRQLRIEREALYTDNRAVLAVWREILSPTNSKGSSVGHFVMAKEDSFHIKSPEDIWLMEELIKRRCELGEREINEQ